MLFIDTAVLIGENIYEDTIEILLDNLADYDGYVTDDVWLDVKELGYKKNIEYLKDRCLSSYFSYTIFDKKKILNVLNIFYGEILKHTPVKSIDFEVKIMDKLLIVAVNYED